MTADRTAALEAAQRIIDPWSLRAAVVRDAHIVARALLSAAKEADRMREALEDADGCFEAALAEGWLDALANGDIERIRDLWERRLSYARNLFPAALSSTGDERREAVERGRKRGHEEAFSAVCAWVANEPHGDIDLLSLSKAIRSLSCADAPTNAPRLDALAPELFELAQAVVNTTLYDETTGFDEDAAEALAAMARDLIARAAIERDLPRSLLHAAPDGGGEKG